MTSRARDLSLTYNRIGDPYQHINCALVEQEIPQGCLSAGWVCVHHLSIPAPRLLLAHMLWPLRRKKAPWYEETPHQRGSDTPPARTTVMDRSALKAYLESKVFNKHANHLFRQCRNWVVTKQESSYDWLKLHGEHNAQLRLSNSCLLRTTRRAGYLPDHLHDIEELIRMWYTGIFGASRPCAKPIWD
jgi:hypothetical protein